jgi:YjbE family integral membrane protein
MDLRFLAAAGTIVLVDLVLSGDNALVIGAAASRLPRGRRFFAIVWGGAFAIIFRLILAIVATSLLQVPLLRAVGGAILLIIAIRLLWPDDGTGPQRQASDRLLPAILTILLADATMSLDNVLAVGAIAADAAPNDPNRYVPLLVAGLLFSMVLLFVASAVISRLIEWIPILIDLAAVVLGWTAANLIAADTVVGRQFQLTGDRSLYLHLGCVAVVLVADLVLRLVRRGRGKKAAAADTAPGVPEQQPEQSSTAGRE